MKVATIVLIVIATLNIFVGSQLFKSRKIVTNYLKIVPNNKGEFSTS